MKYGTARFVYGLAAVFLIFASVNTVLVMFVEDRPTELKEIAFTVALSILVSAIPLGLGVFCLFRYRYWHREAIRMKIKPEPTTPPYSEPATRSPQG